MESFAAKKIERRADTGKVQNCRQRLKKEANQKEKNYQDCPTQQVPDTRTYSFLALSNQIFCCQLVVLAVWSGAEECSRTTVYSVQQCTAVSAGRRPLLLSSSKFSMIVAQSAVHLFNDRLTFFFPAVEPMLLLLLQQQQQQQQQQRGALTDTGVQAQTHRLGCASLLRRRSGHLCRRRRRSLCAALH